MLLVLTAACYNSPRENGALHGSTVIKKCWTISYWHGCVALILPRMLWSVGFMRFILPHQIWSKHPFNPQCGEEITQRLYSSLTLHHHHTPSPSSLVISSPTHFLLSGKKNRIMCGMRRDNNMDAGAKHHMIGGSKAVCPSGSAAREAKRLLAANAVGHQTNSCACRRMNASVTAKAGREEIILPSVTLLRRFVEGLCLDIFQFCFQSPLHQ